MVARHRCHYWTQDLYGRRSTYLDGVHGSVATALPLIRVGTCWMPKHGMRGRAASSIRSGARWTCSPHANWRPELDGNSGAQKKLVQFCHGAPGFVVCLAGLPGAALDDLLLAAGETVWSAGPLLKGSDLCHGTGGNGYALLKLYGRTSDARWLKRCARRSPCTASPRPTSMRGFHGQMRYSLGTGDLGFAVYLWDCLRAEARFPTLDVFHADSSHAGA